VVGYALQRELTTQEASRFAAAAATAPAQRALTPEEENYAAALWPIHSTVKLKAVEMSFAGIAYKMGDQDAEGLKARVQPLAEGFETALARARTLQVPASLTEVHGRYLGALALYEQAAAEMVSATRDGKDEHLAAGQQLSMRATEDMLRVGDVLWPGEYKPH
jgi:hypothetical protein